MRCLPDWYAYHSSVTESRHTDFGNYQLPCHPRVQYASPSPRLVYRLRMGDVVYLYASAHLNRPREDLGMRRSLLASSTSGVSQRWRTIPICGGTSRSLSLSCLCAPVRVPDDDNCWLPIRQRQARSRYTVLLDTWDMPDGVCEYPLCSLG